MADPWFKFFASDYLLDDGIDGLPLEAQGILVRLWCLAWRDQLLKDDPDTLARRAAVDRKVFNKHWPALRAFFSETPEGLVSERMERERSESRCVSESRRLGARITNEKRWGKRDAEHVAQSSLSDKNGVAERIAERPVERIAQVSLSESESETEKESTPSATPQGSRGEPKPKRRGKIPADDLGVQPPLEVLNAVGRIVELTPRADSDGRVIRTVKPEVLERMTRILAEFPSATPEILVQAWESYLRTRPQRIKAPQYFFGRQEDQGETGANWLPFARGIFIAQQQAGVRGGADAIPA